MLIGGQPGIGKTRLAAEHAFVARREGRGRVARTLRRGDGRSIPAVRGGVRHDVDQGSDLGARLGRYSGELIRLVPELAVRVVDLPARCVPTRRPSSTDSRRGGRLAHGAVRPVARGVGARRSALGRHGDRVALAARIRSVGAPDDHWHLPEVEAASAGALGQLLADLHGAPGVERLDSPHSTSPA